MVSGSFFENVSGLNKTVIAAMIADTPNSRADIEPYCVSCEEQQQKSSDYYFFIYWKINDLTKITTNGATIEPMRPIIEHVFRIVFRIFVGVCSTVLR